METKRTKRILSGLCLLAMTAFVSTGCGGKDDDPAPGTKKMNMKVTISVVGLEASDNVYFQIGAANHDASQYGAPVWKMNGTTQGNTHMIELKEQQFLGSTKTYVLETVKAFDFGSLNFDYSNQGAPLTVSYKVEIDGKVKTNVQNKVVPAGGTDDQSLTYKPE